MGEEDALDQAILEAARSLLEKGKQNFTMEQLAAQVGISRATVYRRVGGKEALLQRLARESVKPIPPSDTRQRILHAARMIFGREGLAAATMEHIAREAGVGVATVYRLFGTKENLIHAFMEEMAPKAALRHLTVHPTDDLRGDLHRIVAAVVAFFHEHRDILRLTLLGLERERRYLTSLRQDSDSLLGFLTDYFRHQQEAQRIRSTEEPQELALALLGLILAFVLIAPVHYGLDPTPLEKVTDIIAHIFLDGIRR